MAWSSPKTYVAGNVLTAAEMNSYQRDNFNAFSTQAWTWSAVQTYSADVRINALRKLFLDGGDNTYIWESAADRIETVCGGVISFGVTTTYVQIPSLRKFYFDGASNTYIWESAADRIEIVCGEGISFGVTTTYVQIPSLRKFYFDGASNTYIWESAADTLKTVCGDTVVITSTSALTTFATVVTGVAPTIDLHLATKKYVDDTVSGAGHAAASLILTAGVGLSGGGNLSADRTFTLDLNELGIETSIAAGDFLAMVDITDSGSQKITFANLEAALDHGSIPGRSDDDHTQYILVTGTRAFTGDVKINATKKLFLDGGSNTYIWESAPDVISFVRLGAEILRVDGAVRVIARSLRIDTTQSFYFDGGSNTYIWESAADTLKTVCGGSTVITSTASLTTFATVVTGVAPTIDLHLSTKKYVDDTVSGAGHVPTSRNLTAGVGLSGGGNLSADRTFTLDLNELGIETSIAAGDFVAMVDITDGGSQKITFANFESALNHDALAGFVGGEHFTVASIDHGSIAGRGDDDHTQYILVTGTRAFTGDQTWPDNVKITLGTGGDVDIYYDTVNLVINPKVAGSGIVSILGGVTMAGALGGVTTLAVSGVATLSGNVDISGADIAVDPARKIHLSGLAGDTYITELSANNVRMLVGGAVAMGWGLSYTYIQANDKFYFDGLSNTYIWESAADTLKTVVGGTTVVTSTATLTTFATVVTGVAPTIDLHLATKKYVDDNVFGGDHGALTGRSDDDHTLYILVDGTRAFTGDVKINTTKKLLFDGGGHDHTYIYESSNDRMDFVVGANLGMYLNVAGDLFIDGGYNTFDSVDDLSLIRSMEMERNPEEIVRSAFDGVMHRFDRDFLIKSKLISFENGKIMVNNRQYLGLLGGSIGQLTNIVYALCERIAELDGGPSFVEVRDG